MKNLCQWTLIESKMPKEGKKGKNRHQKGKGKDAKGTGKKGREIRKEKKVIRKAKVRERARKEKVWQHDPIHLQEGHQ